MAQWVGGFTVNLDDLSSVLDPTGWKERTGCLRFVCWQQDVHLVIGPPSPVINKKEIQKIIVENQTTHSQFDLSLACDS